MITIPLVVHVVYNTPEQNISDAQIKSQIDVLNQDYNRKNPDASQTPAAFTPVAGEAGIQFCLVKTTRTQTSIQSFTDNNQVKFTSSGGIDAYDVTKYFNVWVCYLADTLLGYAEFPTSTPSPTYGVVITYRAFGTTGTAAAPYNKGRTLTHELAHALGVHHVFDESKDACVKTDFCADIPSQSAPTGGCPPFPKTDNCSLNDPGIMFMNFMDYSDDSCMNIFTQDQVKRMNAVLGMAPYNNLALTGCNAPPSGPENTVNNVSLLNQLRNGTGIFTVKNWIIFIIILFLLWFFVLWRRDNG